MALLFFNAKSAKKGKKVTGWQDYEDNKKLSYRFAILPILPLRDLVYPVFLNECKTLIQTLM